MLEFKKPELSDKAWVKKAMQNSGEMGCDYCFGNLYAWSEYYGNTIASYDGLFLSRDSSESADYYLYPCGEGDKKGAIEELIRIHNCDGKKLEMYCLTPEKVRELDSMFPNRFEFIEQREFFDYIYLSSELISLPGRKLHSKRNHISFFKNNYNWSYERITPDNICDCYEMNKKWEAINSEYADDGLDAELTAIKKAFANYEELEFTGGLLRVDGEVVAYTFGEAINSKVFCTHFEKAFYDVRGAYPMINQQFCENELSAFKYINREEDTGDEGLRQAKMSYRPAILLPKFLARYKG
ncbi:MAG: DUF2156 domain-containing protein [Clostridia bacterium]|nr:DUF2156 domain-containing protein [Clostridia bacterium]